MEFAKQIDDASTNRDSLRDVPSRELQRWVEEAIGWRRPDGTPVRVSPTNETRRLDDAAPVLDDNKEPTQKRPLTRLILALVITIVCIGGSLWVGSRVPRYDNLLATPDRVFSRTAVGSAGLLDQTSKAVNAPPGITGSTPTPQSASRTRAGDQASFDATRSNQFQHTRTQPPGAISPAEDAKLVARAESLIKQFDFATARLWLAYALEKGSARAAFMMAETYDPQILRSLPVYGMRGDAQRARELYQLAATAGIEKARERLEALELDANFDGHSGRDTPR